MGIVSSAGRAWGNRILWGSHVAGACKLECTDPAGIQLHTSPGLTGILARVHQKPASLDLAKVHRLPEGLSVLERLVRPWQTHGIGF